MKSESRWNSNQRTDVYAAEITTCTGETIADLIGWKYDDMTLSWEALPQDMVDILVNMSGICRLIFDDADGIQHTENVIRTSVVYLRHRYTQNGIVWWKEVEVEVKFVNVNH